MVHRPDRMKFGIFMAPFHRIGENPTLALERDLELIKHLDRLGYDEAWIGEHHSAGWEIIADPTLFIAAAAQHTRTIKLGTGVTSLPYHHPLMVADRMVQLDHMTRGRAMLGVGPGALTSDAYMMGIDALTQREKMDEGLAAIMALLKAEGPVNMETGWFVLRDARLQMASYTRPHLPIAVASTFSPAGPVTAGKHGAGVLSVAVSQPGGLISLERTWKWTEEAAGKAGKAVNRDEWRLVMPIHLADSREEAIKDVANASLHFNQAYFEGTLGRPTEPGQDTIESAIERGGAIVGTPDDAIAAIDRMLELSGGFGGILAMAHEWTSTEKILHSYELWARYVAPRFQGQLEPIEDNQQWVAEHRGAIFGPSVAAIGKAFADAGAPIPAEMAERMQRGRT
jgi:limonene 1,2-monooxygenase